ncbi:MAG: putative toxin-antitoxin system toxin component, PIN family [Chitinispirillia bacterium]|nr:putative toxin-antitoxin system toxin component, PIN family [Chitinispirillia bacterium]MCL2267973.1 putative toxin-antitoxin system toxin component, PIN family [Chitinispirillia bacterium]
MRVVVDTNVLVSALMNANGAPARVLSLILNGDVKILCDNRIIFEYADVLTRKEFGFNAGVVNDLIDYFKYDGEYVNASPLGVNFKDEDDKKFYEVYKSADAQYLITGNIKHFPKEDKIIGPREFLGTVCK